ncbi:MAG: DUF1080 domain-containing protein [Mariniphaga sp.]|nr:DUF1080 domain-containing protein [Mariniphaga sp.]
MKNILLFLSLAFLFSCSFNSDKWISLFDGESLDGWTISENQGSFTVENGSIKCNGERAHLFLEGKSFKNFEFETEVMTREFANSGIFIHTKFQEEGWPEQGYEIQVNNTHIGEGNYRELKKTGSIYGIRNIYYPIVGDDVWFKMRIKVVENNVQVFVNDVKVADYIESENMWRPDGRENLSLSEGTIALQAHDPGSTVYYKNLKIKELPEGEKKEMLVDKTFDDNITKLMLSGFPVVDHHVHLKGGLTIEEVVENSQRLGINYGVAPNCGLMFPVTDDESLYEYMNSIKGTPVIKGMQAEGREWVTLFSPEAVAKFDYVFTDAMTFTDDQGRRNRIWMPDEVWVDDKEEFMDMLVGKIEAIFSQEPVDIYVNPTVLPAIIEPEYDELWTLERKQRVIKVLAENNIALEINSRYKLPKADMIIMAKEAGVKFTFGTNNTGNELGELEYCLQMIKECGLTSSDMFELKPDGKKSVQIKGLPEKITG